jgi:hypothetical protein
MLDWDTSATTGLPEGKEAASRILELGGRMWVFLLDNPQMRSELWSSADGKDWTLAGKPDFLAGRMGYFSLARDGKLWVIGNSPGGSYDVWSSPDGLAWTRATASIGFWPASQPVIQGGKIWLFGGKEGSVDNVDVNGIWSSPDGVTWTQAAASILNPPRSSPALAAQGGRLWLLGGMNTDGTGAGDVWSSADGVHWSSAVILPPALRIPGIGFMEFNGKMWAVGGSSPDQPGPSGYRESVWMAPYP